MSVDPSMLADTHQTFDQLTKSMTGLNSLSTSFGKSITEALKGAVVQGKQFDTVLRGLATGLSNRALNVALAPISNAIGSGINQTVSGVLSSIFGLRSGGVVAGGRIQPFADGGIVSSPSYFPLSGGGTGLMGEAGAEAVMPLRRGPDGRLGVTAASGQSPLSVTFNVTSPDVAGFARSEAQLTGMLARAVGRGRRGL
ncbi:MAG: phage tail tape measure protein [Ancalomicrobiaceae bacterium]|nr:phage tail tape measure protein [Ancalomicrobiaceae bacterium]